MGSDRFSSDNKKKNVNLLKQLLATNLDNKKTSNPLETLFSDLDLGSLEDLLQRNKKSHDDFDHKKKRHHNDFDHKKKHHDDDCHDKKKCCHDDDCHDKKKHHHDDCHDKKKHHHDDCHDKKKCCHDDGGDMKMFHKDDCGCHKDPCKKCFKHDCDCEKCKCPCDAAAAVCALIGKIFWVLKDPELVTEPPELPAPAPEPPAVDKLVLIRLLKKLIKRLEKDCKIKSSLLDDADELMWWLMAAEEEVPSVLIWKIKKFLKDLLKCLGLKKDDCIGHDLFFPGFPGVPPEEPEEPEEPGTGTGTITERLLSGLFQQVEITTPTGTYVGTLVTVQDDYIALVEANGTRLIAIDTIQTFSIG